MSTLLYGALSAQRKAAPENESTKDKPPGLGTYVDIAAALVPAEVLAVNITLLQTLSDQTSVKGDEAVTVPALGDLQLIFWLSVAVSIALYFIGVWSRAKTEAKSSRDAGSGKPWKELNWLRALVPAVAYTVWAMLEQPSAFDGVAENLSDTTRLIIATFAALILAGIAKLLSDKADARDPG
jgi:cytochrome bd-type quinol oxidase subunit 2